MNKIIHKDVHALLHAYVRATGARRASYCGYIAEETGEYATINAGRAGIDWAAYVARGTRSGQVYHHYFANWNGKCYRHYLYANKKPLTVYMLRAAGVID